MANVSESDYLKEDLGPVLAKGLAAVAMARPQNPIEYLGLWMLHYLQERERKAEAIKAQKELEAEREEWVKGRAMREKQATSVIQREWRAHLRAEEERKSQEVALRELFASVEENAEEVKEEVMTYGTAAEGPDATGDDEKILEEDRSANYMAWQHSQQFVNVLDKSHIAAMKTYITERNEAAVTVLRCCFYAQGFKASKVDTLDKMKALLKPYNFCEWLKSFDPIGNPISNSKSINRVRRLLGTVDEDSIKDTSVALHTIFSWLKAASLYRYYRDEHVRMRREAGKETGEDELEEVDDVVEQPPDDIDLVEEEIKEHEEADRKRREEERMAEEAEEQEETEQ